MADPRRSRLDAYGSPTPPLTDARRQYLGDSTSNQEQKRFLYTLLEAKLREVLRRGFYGKLHLCCSIEDGTLQRESSIGIEEQVRHP